MAAKSEQLLIVVSISEGRHFPKRPRLSSVVQASFDGEHSETDPAEHREQPQFSTESAWESDRRMSHQHRSQRTPIKLQCFASDPVSKQRENVGYVVSDLRSVQEVRQEPRWYQSLSSKYTKQKPASLVGSVSENDSKAAEASPERFRAKKAPPRQAAGPASGSDSQPERSEARSVPDQGYHQVGPADCCGDMFVLSVTVAFATKSEQSITSTKRSSADDSGFFFYYSLSGNDITSEPFANSSSPDFEPERASVRIRSSEPALRAFSSQQPDLQIHSCCGNRSSGSTDVSFSGSAAAAVDSRSKAATVEGAFPSRPPRRSESPHLPADSQPTVGVAVTSRREELTPQVLGNPDPATSLLLPPAVAPSAESPSPVHRPTDSPPLPPPSSRTESEAESSSEERDLHRKQAADVPASLPAAVLHQPEAGASSVSVSAPKVSIPSSAHHYCFSSDLCSSVKLSLPHPIAATLRYSYQFFGSSAPIMTNPAVESHRNMEASSPQSYCAFDFAASPHQSQDTFLRVPSVVESWDRGSTSRDQSMGSASIQSHHSLRSEKTRSGSAGDPSWRQTHRDRIPVVHPERPTERVAELSYEATSEDLGFVKAKEVQVSDSSQTKGNKFGPT